MNKKYIGAIDQGTSSTRFAIIDSTGHVVATAQSEHRQIFPHPGYVEHDPQEILTKTHETAAAALEKAGLTAADLAAIGITNQRETTVLWDKKTGHPLHNALVWQDTRVDQEVAEMAKSGGPNRFRAQTGLPLASYFSALKLQWLLDHVPQARAMAENGDALFGSIDSWLAFHLTGQHVTDITNASRTQLMDLKTLAWAPNLLEAFNIPAACLPRIVPTSAMIAPITTGPLKGVPLAAMVGDQQAALIGQTCFSPGEAKNTYGTGNFLLLNTGETPIASSCGLITTLAYQFGTEKPVYALEGSIAVTGSLIQWLRDNLHLIATASEADYLAAEVADCGGVHIVPAFSGLYAPYWRGDARGVITGLTRYADRRHICRAALEAAAFQTRDVVDAMAKDSGTKLKELCVDGGMTRSNILLQAQADILGVGVIRPMITETTVMGAAYAAGLAVGIWPNTESLRAHWHIDQQFSPNWDEQTRAKAYANWQKAVTRSFDLA